MKKENPDHSRIEIRSQNLLKIVEADLLPPERFVGRKEGRILGVARIDDTIATINKAEGYYFATIYNTQGKPVEIDLEPKIKDILSSIRGDFRRQTGNRFVQGHFQNMGFSLKEAKKLDEAWVKALGNATSDVSGDVHRHSFDDSLKEKYISLGDDWSVEVRRSSREGDLFIFSNGDSRFRIDPVEPFEKKPLDSATFEGYVETDTQLVGGYKLEEGDKIFNIVDRNGAVMASYEGVSPTVDPSDTEYLYFISPQEKVKRVNIKKGATREEFPVVEKQVQIDKPTEIDIDPNGNFLIIRTEDKKLHILEKESGTISDTFEGVNGPVLLDNQGDILYLDDQGRLREIQTNFNAIPSGGIKESRERRQAELRKLLETFEKLDLEQVAEEKRGVSESEVEEALRKRLDQEVVDKLSGIKSGLEVRKMITNLEALKNSIEGQQYKSLIDEYVTRSREKLSELDTLELGEMISGFNERLESVDSLGDSINLDNGFYELVEERQSIEIADRERRREIDYQIRKLAGLKDAKINRYQGELVGSIEENFPSIEELIKEVGSPEELSVLATSSEMRKFEIMLANVRDLDKRRELRGKLKELKDLRKEKIGKRQLQLDLRRKYEWAEQLSDAFDRLSILDRLINGVDTLEELAQIDSHPEVVGYRSGLFGLPEKIIKRQMDRLSAIKQSKEKRLKLKSESGIKKEGETIKFGNVEMPVYTPPPVLWRPELLPITEEPGTAELVFKDTSGRTWKPGGEERVVVVDDIDNEKTSEAIERHQKEAADYFEGRERDVPEYEEHWKITDFHIEKLEELAEVLGFQIKHQKGILLLQGEAGTGKNVLIDILAHFTNREVIQIPCNESSVKEDLLYEFHYDPRKGTYKLPSNLVEGVQRPGTIILFDEINALKPGVAKLLNSLTDYRRRLISTEGGVTKDTIVDPTVILIGTMNRQNYLGVHPLSPEVKSRSRIMDFDYPPFDEIKNGAPHWRSDEAEMMYQHVDSLKTLSQNEFKQCWNDEINQEADGQSMTILSGDARIKGDIRRLYDVIRVANKLRKMYDDYQIGEANEPIDQPISLREVEDIVLEMNAVKNRKVKDVVKRVFLPKIDDRRQKKLLYLVKPIHSPFLFVWWTHKVN